MAKSPRRPGKPARPDRAKAGAEAEAAATLPNPWARLIEDTRKAVFHESLEHGHYETVMVDGQLLAECATLGRLNQRPLTVTEGELERALLRASVRRPYTLAGWRAKVELALMVIEASRDPDQAPDDYERMVPWLVLKDVLEVIDGLDPQAAWKHEPES